LYIQEEKAEEAKKWIDKALVLAYETKNNAAILRANLDRLQLALITKDWTEANARMRYLDEALLNRHSIKIRAEYYSLRSKWNEELGNYQKALVDYRSFRSLNDSLLKQQDLVAITNAEFQYEYEKKQVDYLLLEEKKRSETFLKWFLFLLLVILAFGVGIIFRQIQTKRKQEMEIFELKNQQMQETLNKTENELKNVVRNLIDKNKVLNELTAEIENLHKQQEDGKDTSKNEELWDQLQSFTLLTEEDWVEFKRLFEKRFSGFFDYFQSKFPDITNAEMRMAALLRLNLENIEMAKALGISPDSVRKTNLRLRKRLNIEDQRELLELIHSIG
jgi:DNA-binding CsgD family transcriptional regulator